MLLSRNYSDTILLGSWYIEILIEVIRAKCNITWIKERHKKDMKASKSATKGVHNTGTLSGTSQWVSFVFTSLATNTIRFLGFSYILIIDNWKKKGVFVFSIQTASINVERHGPFVYTDTSSCNTDLDKFNEADPFPIFRFPKSVDLPSTLWCRPWSPTRSSQVSICFSFAEVG